MGRGTGRGTGSGSGSGRCSGRGRGSGSGSGSDSGSGSGRVTTGSWLGNVRAHEFTAWLGLWVRISGLPADPARRD